ncbi:hypothetical protein D4Z78_17275, partial [Okeania hirsuta]
PLVAENSGLITPMLPDLISVPLLRNNSSCRLHIIALCAGNREQGTGNRGNKREQGTGNRGNKKPII